MFDINALDRVEITSAAGTTVVIAEPSSPKNAVVPFTYAISGFFLSFIIGLNSPSERNYGFIICYTSSGESKLNK